ncbi:MAG: cell envelope integrity protein CreD [Variovorax sp.]
MLVQLRNSVLLKVFGLLALTLALYIPLSEIRALIAERGQSQQQAKAELAATYVGEQTVVGPLLVLPYTERWIEPQRDLLGKRVGQLERSKEMVHVVFPETLAVEGSIEPQERYRGIFQILFYVLQGSWRGSFAAFDRTRVLASEKDASLEFRSPYLAFNLSDLRGLNGAPAVQLAGETLRFAQRLPGLADDAWLSRGIHAPLTGAALAAWSAGRALPFELKLSLVGQEKLALVPIADETTAHLTSSWPHPSFGGRFLAAQRSVSDAGFDARWRVSALVTEARDQVRAGLRSNAGIAERVIHPSDVWRNLESFDVSLVQPLNVYAMSTRAAKYGLLFIGLVLMAAFMFEIFRKLRLHPVQYGLVGLSIALFFLLLLAFSEKVAFPLAYAGAAAASVLLLGGYFSAVLGGWRRATWLAAFVALLYAALYGLLASESNALLLGASLIFGMLALLMLATRKVDWYALSARRLDVRGDSAGAEVAS